MHKQSLPPPTHTLSNRTPLRARERKGCSKLHFKVTLPVATYLASEQKLNSEEEGSMRIDCGSGSRCGRLLLIVLLLVLTAGVVSSSDNNNISSSSSGNNNSSSSSSDNNNSSSCSSSSDNSSSNNRNINSSSSNGESVGNSRSPPSAREQGLVLEAFFLVCLLAFLLFGAFMAVLAAINCSPR